LAFLAKIISDRLEVKIKRKLIYWDSCVMISYLMNEDRPDHEMDGVYDCIEQVEKGAVTLIMLRNTMFEEVHLRSTEVAEKFRKFMMRRGIELPSIDIRIERLAVELRDYYAKNGPKELREKDSLHLAAAIHYRADAFYTFDGGNKGGLNLLSLNGNVGGYPLVVCKPPFNQTRLL